MRRVFPLLCRRDLLVKKKEAKAMLQLCQHICDQGHVIVTVREHRLSPENKVLELAWNRDIGSSRTLYKVVKFLSENGREVLDESDEIPK